RDRGGGRLLLVRHQRSDADDAGILARRRRRRLPAHLPGGRCAGQEPLRDARPARGGEDDRAGLRAGPGRQTVDQARHLRRARRRSGIDRLLRGDRPRLRVVLAVSGADRPAGSRPGRACGNRDGRRGLAMRIDVAFAPGRTPDAAVAVVIDVLRATTTITQAIDSGYQRVLACGELEQARALAARFNGGAVLAGERQCVKPEGFDLGNSPSEFAGPPLGETLVLTTTNGTRAIVAAAAHADTVVIGSLLNLISCGAHVARKAREAQGDVLVQCAGVRGEFT